MHSCHSRGGKASDPSRTKYFLKCLVFYTELEIGFSENINALMGLFQIWIEEVILNFLKP